MLSYEEIRYISSYGDKAWKDQATRELEEYDSDRMEDFINYLRNRKGSLTPCHHVSSQ